MDPEANKLDTASRGLIENEVKLLEALKLLGIKPNVDSPEGMMKLVQAFRVKPDPKPIHIVTHANAEKPGSFQYPRISTFYGEDIKNGEVNYHTFKYEIEALRKSKVFTDDQILLGIRRALKGSAADFLRRLGPDVALDEILFKLENIFGSKESR
ncbi:hypothetical protein DPMN_157797 [Dreissena polymorpha]|uniref:Uncharacterized protein n=1 Tax=Dreissena polymorpha TaxID=45954 RepID=A0A9D4IQC1_DREPO|nr:hypothetical protein DPMN_157797 [Dreissena polymorpha]